MKIITMPEHEFNILPGESLLQTLVRQHVPLRNVCNGKGTCGKCKVRFLSNAPEATDKERRHLKTDELNQGVRLACQIKPEADMVIEVAEEVAYDRKEAALYAMEGIELLPGVEKIFLSLPKPSLQDERGDWERVVDELAKVGKVALNRPSHYLLQKLPAVLRQNNFDLTVVMGNEQIIDVEAGDTSQVLYGLAVDIGTTSVAVALVDLASGKVLKVASTENGQAAYGADVISRIAYAGESKENRLQLQAAIRETINRLIDNLVSETGVAANHIYKMTVVGNTTMHHLLLGLDVTTLAVSPYVSVCTASLEFKANILGLQINPQAILLMLPNIASFVGGDTVGAVLGAQDVLGEGNHLLIDLGTNCELFLKAGTSMYACSTAAGPAFEGARISQGMRAKPGAIEGVKLTNQSVEIEVIGNQPAVGICGSGLIEAIDQMKRAGVISKQGAIRDTDSLDPALRERIRPGEHGREFVLAYGTSDTGDVVLNQKDIGELQLAKGAVCAGIKTLVEIAGISLQELDTVVLAGTFATYLNKESILQIGLVPNLAPEKVKTAGNAAHVGALRALLNQKESAKAAQLAQRVKHVELGGNKTFSNYFMKSMYLEITD